MAFEDTTGAVTQQALYNLGLGGETAENELEASRMALRPSTRFKPNLSIDGNMWCALYGSNLQDGVAGFGVTPEASYADFDKAWGTALKSGKAA
jgi:hypothetical protein